MRFKLDVNYLEVEQKVIKKHNCGIISEIKLSKRRGIYHVSSLYVRPFQILCKLKKLIQDMSLVTKGQSRFFGPCPFSVL